MRSRGPLFPGRQEKMFTRSALKRIDALIFIVLIKLNLSPNRKTNKGFISQMSEKASIVRIFKGIVRVIIWLWRSLLTPAAYKLITEPIKAFVCWLTGGSPSQQMKTLSGKQRRSQEHVKCVTGRAYIRDVSQLDLQLGLRGLGLRSHCHGDDLGVHDRVIPARRKSENCLSFGWLNDFNTDGAISTSPRWSRGSCSGASGNYVFI